SVSGPRCGGNFTMMPRDGSRPVRTSQKLSFVRTPTPSGDGHVKSADATVGFTTTGTRRFTGVGACFACPAKLSDVATMSRAAANLADRQPTTDDCRLTTDDCRLFFKR